MLGASPLICGIADVLHRARSRSAGRASYTLFCGGKTCKKELLNVESTKKDMHWGEISGRGGPHNSMSRCRMN